MKEPLRQLKEWLVKSRMKYNLSSRFPKKRAFITGAASGLGKQFAIELAADGWLVGITDLKRKSLKDTEEKVSINGGTFLSFGFDVSDEKAYQKAASEFLKKAGGIDLLINNAGVGDGGDVGQYSLENWRWILGINVMGVVHGCHFFAAAFQSQRSGHIINISSAASFSNLPTMAAYSATKAAVRSIGEVLDSEWKPYNVSVSIVMPTFIHTNIMQHSRGRDEQRSEMTSLLLKTSGLTPESVVPMILHKAGKKKLHIVFPFTAKLAWFFSHYMPWLWRMLKVSSFGDRERLIRKLKKKKHKMDRKKKKK